ncbi:MAG: hypothetical protein HOP19_28975 [Acidobacteria bacterium]|nr:hypothetical protein [Acidobacteriota bacterium]
MHQRTANNFEQTAGIKCPTVPFAFVAPLTTWHALMPQTVINRRDVSRYGVYRWKLLPHLKENS